MKHKSFCILGALLLLFLAQCGRRTAPKPVLPKPTIEDAQIKQIGDELRLSWKMRKNPNFKAEPDLIEIEEYDIPDNCLECTPTLVEKVPIQYPAKQPIRGVAIRDKRIIYIPQIKLTESPKLFILNHLDSLLTLQSKPLELNFQGKVELPRPSAPILQNISLEDLNRLKIFPLQIPQGGEDLTAIRIGLPKVREHTEFIIPPNGDAKSRSAYYKVNIYKALAGEEFGDTPINNPPTSESFYIDYQSQNTHSIRYQLRFVDQAGNESFPSETAEFKGANP